MKKAKQTRATRGADEKPTKITIATRGVDAFEAEIPRYRGPMKTGSMPKLLKKDNIKKRFERTNIERPPRSAKQINFGDQMPRGSRRDVRLGAERQQYVRLRIRVSNGRLSVVDSHLVDGPLGQVTAFPSGNAYEVTLGDRLLHAGALPDVGVQRSFPNPRGPREQRGHYLTEQSVYEFMARIPASEVTRDTIGRIAVRLHRVKEHVRAEHVGNAPLAQQFERNIRPVAELVGLPESALPEAIDRRGGRTAKG